MKTVFLMRWKISRLRPHKQGTSGSPNSSLFRRKYAKEIKKKTEGNGKGMHGVDVPRILDEKSSAGLISIYLIYSLALSAKLHCNRQGEDYNLSRFLDAHVSS